MAEVKKLSLVEARRFLYKDKRAFETALQCTEKVANKYLLGIYNTLVNNSRLMECDIESIKNAAITSATLGVPIDARGYAYLIPYKGKVQFQMSYKGYVYIAKQDKDVDSITPILVYPDDDFSVDLGTNTITHIPHLESDTYGNEKLIRFAYAVVRFRHDTGRSQMFEVMTKKQIDEIRASSKAGGEKDKWGKPTIWEKHYGEMAKKTVIKRLCKHAQLGDVATYDEIDNAVLNEKIINVTPSGELLVDEPDIKLRDEIIEAVEKCDSSEGLKEIQAKYQDKMQEIYLYNTKVSKQINTVMGIKQDALYMEDVTEWLESCEDEESTEKVYEAHKVRINQLKAKDRNAVTEIYVNRKQYFIDAGVDG